MKYLKELIERLGKALRIKSPPKSRRVRVDEPPRARPGPGAGPA